MSGPPTEARTAFARRRLRPAPFGAVLFLAMCAGCATPQPPPADTPLAAALTFFGTIQTVDGTSPEPEVVVIRDRHATGGGITYVDDELRALQKEHHALVTYLVGRGFHLFGCEFRKGPLPTDGVGQEHLGHLEWAAENGDDPNRWSVYQPLRYQHDFGPKLLVVGVEDPDLYDADVSSVEKLTETARLQRRPDWTSGPTDADLKRREVELLGNIRKNVARRGAAAARNLAALLVERKERRAILMLGAAHVPAASLTLADLGIRHHVFTAASFERRAPQRR